MSTHRDPDPLPVVILEDDPIHTDPYPFCSDPTCPCHDDFPEAIGLLTDEVNAGLLTSEEASNIVQGKQVYQAGW